MKILIIYDSKVMTWDSKIVRLRVWEKEMEYMLVSKGSKMYMKQVKIRKKGQIGTNTGDILIN